MIAHVSVNLKNRHVLDHRKVNVLRKRRYFLSKSQQKRGLPLYPENTDGLLVRFGSVGTGKLKEIMVGKI